jgi:pimeloyl-ACP methyl ester carboxylesterase
MGKTYSVLDEGLRALLQAQHVFFVATAPSGPFGHVNVSPKGLDTLRVLSDTTVAYLDFTGSGIETIAHLRDNARIVLMVCAFEGPPKILRLWGRGEALEPHERGFAELRALFGEHPGVRAIVRIEVERITDACGYAVPLYRFEGDREQLGAWAENKGVEGLLTYRQEKNAKSIDGLPGLRALDDDAGLGQLSEPTRRWADTGRFVRAAGHRVFVVDRGQGPPLLLLHGFPTAAHDWRRLIERLCDRHRCVAPDLLGFGLSDKPIAASYSLMQQADVVEGVMRQLGLRSAHVVSHDMGTSVHCELLARQHDGALSFAIERSTLLNGSVLQWRAAITPFQQLLASNATLLQGIDVCERIPDAYVAGLRSLMKRPEGIDEQDAVVLRELLVREDGHRRLPAIAGYMRERHVHKDRWLGALTRAGSKLQFVWGTGDPIAHAELGRELAALCPEARYTELDGVGHFVPMEDPERVALAIESSEAAG